MGRGGAAFESRRPPGPAGEVDRELLLVPRLTTVVATHHLDVAEPGLAERVQNLAEGVDALEENVSLVGDELAGPLSRLNLASQSSRVGID